MNPAIPRPIPDGVRFLARSTDKGGMANQHTKGSGRRKRLPTVAALGALALAGCGSQAKPAEKAGSEASPQQGSEVAEPSRQQTEQAQREASREQVQREASRQRGSEAAEHSKASGEAAEPSHPQGDRGSVELAEHSKASGEAAERVKAGKETPLDAEAKLEAAERGETPAEAKARLEREGAE
jgi:hypothetical protein